ncbi:MAG: aldo/keto reductase family protein [Anaerolineae bacterium]|nr:aldo/keto reductase family protein [Anaerolineae bacterium]
MNYRRLGKSGLKVSALSLGGWTTFGDSVADHRLARDILVKAYDNGINFFDIANVYARGEAEKLMGSVLRLFPRHTLVISSKAFWPMSDDVNDRGLSRKHLFESVHASLRRIGTDYLDLFFCHRWDAETPLEETVRALDDLVHQGKILYWGTSEWTGAQIQAALDLCERYNLVKPQVEQPLYNLIARRKVEEDVLPVTEKNGLGLVVWSPLASGLLTGKYDDALPGDSRLARLEVLRDQWYKAESVAAIRELKAVADDLGVTRAQLALAWTLRQPGVSSAITGATRPAQLDETLKAIDITLDSDTLARMDAIMAPVAQ